MNLFKIKYIYNKLTPDYLCKNPIILYNDRPSEGYDKFYTYEEFKQFKTSEIIELLNQKYFYDTNLFSLWKKAKNYKWTIAGFIIIIIFGILAL